MSPFLLRRLSDELLGSRHATGEAAAIDELYRRYVHRLAAYGAQLIGDASAGDDVAQASLLKAYNALREGRVPDRVRPWLYRIAHNTAIDLVVRRRELPVEHLPETPARPVHAAGEIVAALAALPERQRRVYALRELHGLRIDEIGAALSLTTQQVEQSLFAARNRMAEHLSFGERLDCLAVRRLAQGPLDTGERRALKTHLRSCSGCRQQLATRGRALGLLPAGTFDWLRALGSLLAGGGAPAAAKVGAVIATATIAAGVPSAVDLNGARAVAEPRFHGVPAASPAPSRRPARTTSTAAVVAAPPPALVVQHPEVEHAATRLVRKRPREQAPVARDDGSPTDHSGPGRPEVPETPAAPAVVQEPPSSAGGPGEAPAAIEPAATPATPVETDRSGSGSSDGEDGGHRGSDSGGGSGGSSGSSGSGRDGPS